MKIIFRYFKHNLIPLFKDRLYLNLFLAFLLILIPVTVFGVARFHRLPPEVPLYYSLPKSRDQLASPHMLFLMPLSAGIIFIINTLISSFIHRDEKTAVYILAFSSLAAELICLYSFLKIILLIS